MEKFFESLERAERSLRIADHMTYVTLPLVKEQRLLLKILEEVFNSVLNTVNSILQYEYFSKRINLYSNAKDNFEVFRVKLAGKYGISEQQVAKILELFLLAEKHRASPFEFVKHDKIVIMSGSMQIASFDIVKIKEYLLVAKDILSKTRDSLSRGKI